MCLRLNGHVYNVHVAFLRWYWKNDFYLCFINTFKCIIYHLTSSNTIRQHIENICYHYSKIKILYYDWLCLILMQIIFYLFCSNADRLIGLKVKWDRMAINKSPKGTQIFYLPERKFIGVSPEFNGSNISNFKNVSILFSFEDSSDCVFRSWKLDFLFVTSEKCSNAIYYFSKWRYRLIRFAYTLHNACKFCEISELA